MDAREALEPSSVSNPETDSTEIDFRPRCYGCYRPVDRCFCKHIPIINNQTRVLILQHFRERVHPFNTARILRRSLQNSEMFAGGIDGLATLFSQMRLGNDAALLYPGDGSELLENIPQSEMPHQLVVLDGTWHHTKTIFREIPQLKRLRKVRLAPTEPSRYGIRREPHVLFLSTLEATVAALRCIEPETEGFDKLVAAFTFMVESQMAHPKSEESVRRKHRPRAPLNIPKILRENLENIVAFYAETAPATSQSENVDDSDRMPVYWVAERLGTGERFEYAIAASRPFADTFLAHLEMSQSDFDDAISIDTFRCKWNDFLKPTDTLAYYFSNCTRLLKQVSEDQTPSIYLKSIQLHLGRKSGLLEDLLQTLNVHVDPVQGKGRAGKRLACTKALARYLSSCDLYPFLSQ